MIINLKINIHYLCVKSVGTKVNMIDIARWFLNAIQFFMQYGEDNDAKSFLLEISWGPTYPTEKPTINMNTFYNKHM